MIESKAAPSAPASATGSRPEGASTQQQAAERVREMFGSIAPRYDFLNHLLSLSLDRLWRRRVARRFSAILSTPDSRAIDLCCGTGDLTLELLRVSRGSVYGSDFSRPMLIRAEQKSADIAPKSKGKLAGFIEADALNLPFPDATFDLATNAFGFRNLANYEAGIQEMARILRPGGSVAILEFAQPQSALFGRLYRFYFTSILPKIGRAISGSTFAYSYLPDSVLRFPSPSDLLQSITNKGFVDPKCELWAAGAVALYTAKKS